LETQEARASGRFKDRRSELALDGGQHLKGVDKSNRRAEIIARANHRCEECGKFLGLGGEWHHIVGGLGKKDNIENALYLCNDCHTGPEGKHVQVQWTQKEKRNGE
jgi:5-methylcytosine-specific restriction endonuclease McrA